jgi:hypothetical protein
VKNTARRPKITVSADGQGLVSQAGALLLLETARVTGLGEALSAGLARWRAPRAVHDPGKILTDLVMTLALGGDCLADVAVLRSRPELAGPVASDAVVSRLITALAADTPRALKAIRKAQACARERAWALAGERAPGQDGSLIPVDIDATIVIAHSDKEKAAPTLKVTGIARVFSRCRLRTSGVTNLFVLFVLFVPMFLAGRDEQWDSVGLRWTSLDGHMEPSAR